MSETLHETTQGSRDARMIREKAVAAKEAMSDLAGEVKNYATDRLGKVKAQASDKLRGATDSLIDYVQQNPYKALGIAAGAGLILGILLKRR